MKNERVLKVHLMIGDDVDKDDLDAFIIGLKKYLQMQKPANVAFTVEEEIPASRDNIIYEDEFLYPHPQQPCQGPGDAPGWWNNTPKCN